MHVLDSCTYLIFFLIHFLGGKYTSLPQWTGWYCWSWSYSYQFCKGSVVYFCGNMELCIIQTFEWSLMHILRKHSCHYLELAWYAGSSYKAFSVVPPRKDGMKLCLVRNNAWLNWKQHRKATQKKKKDILLIDLTCQTWGLPAFSRFSLTFSWLQCDGVSGDQDMGSAQSIFPSPSSLSNPLWGNPLQSEPSSYRGFISQLENPDPQ